MIEEYHRPGELAAALQLLARKKPITIPLGGGMVISRRSPENCAVVDLQELGLDQVLSLSTGIKIGAATKLQALVENEAVYPGLRDSITRTCSKNHREMATLSGTVVTSDGRSVLATALLAFGTDLIWEPGEKTVSLENYFTARSANNFGLLITNFLVADSDDFRIETVARTTLDLPQVCVAITKKNKVFRIAIGGFGNSPRVAYIGSDIPSAIEGVAKAFEFSDDAFASSEYRSAAAKQLTYRLLADMTA